MAIIGKATPRSDTVIQRVADIVGCEPAVIDAIIKIEAGKIAYDPLRRLVIRPEAHKLITCPYLNDGERRRAVKMGFTKPPKLIGYHIDAKAAGDSAWGYVDRVAAEFGEETAYYITSFGTPQIMGFNFAMCGYKTPGEMVRAFADSEDEQLLAMGRFLDKSGLREACRLRKWKQIARSYNGPLYHQNNYDAKLEAAYNGSSAVKAPSMVFLDDVLEYGEKGDLIKVLQGRLRELGYYCDIDGDFGAETRDQVRAFQFRAGLPVDGRVDSRTQIALSNATPKPANEKPVASIVKESPSVQSGIATAVTGAISAGVAVANTVSAPAPVRVPLPGLTDIDGVIKVTETGTTLLQKILSIGVDKMLIALGVGGIIFGVITIWRRIQAQRNRSIGG